MQNVKLYHVTKSALSQTVPGQIRVCSLFSESGQTLLRLNCPPCSKADIGQTIQGINCLSGSQRPISYANLLDQDSNFPDQCCVAVIGPRSRKPYGCRQAGWDPLPALSGLGRADAITASIGAARFSGRREGRTVEHVTLSSSPPHTAATMEPVSPDPH